MDILDIFAVIISALLIAIGMQSVIIYCELCDPSYAEVGFGAIFLGGAVNYLSAKINL